MLNVTVRWTSQTGVTVGLRSSQPVVWQLILTDSNESACKEDRRIVQEPDLSRFRCLLK